MKRCIIADLLYYARDDVKRALSRISTDFSTAKIYIYVVGNLKIMVRLY